jgi:hypothetical protein
MKKVNINAVKCGSIINLSVDGKLQKKSCKTPDEAQTLFKAILKAKENPSEANIRAFKMLLSEKLRVAMLAGLEADEESGEIFLAGFNTPIPQTLVDVIEDYYNNGYPLTAIINFWKLLMINPDKRIREKLFDFIKVHDFSLTDAGYMITYKAVERREDIEGNRFAEYVSNQVLRVKKNWKCNPRKYMVYKNLVTGDYGISKAEIAENWDEEAKNVEIMGNLGELFDSIFNSGETDKDDAPVYLSKSNRAPKMEIRLGIPVMMPRSDCDGDPMVECSFGLHTGSTKFVQTFASSTDAILVCLVNPAHIIAIPVADHSKMRTSQYYPFAIASYVDGNIDIVDQQYFEDDYIEYEIEELENMLANVRAEELPVETAINAEKEERPMADLLKIIATRLIDIE